MHRTGAALYSLVVLTTVLVSSIGLAALQLARARGRELTNTNEMSQARAAALASLQLANCKIANSSNWYTQLSGNWLVRNQAYARGSLSISVSDPVDGIVSGDDDSLLVVGTGQQGSAVQRLSMNLTRIPHPRTCLNYGLVAGNGIQANQSTLRSSTAVATSGDVQSTNSTIHANVIASGQVIGLGVAGSITTRAANTAMPDRLRALDYYLLNGTAVSLAGLPRWQQTQIIRNPSFESDTSSWYALTDCTLSRSSTRTASGSWSLRVSNRSSRDDSAAQDITVSSLKNGDLFHLAIPFFPTANGTASARLTLQSTGDGTQVFKLPDFTCAKNAQGNFSWITMEGDLSLSWSGSLTKATLSIDTSFNQDFYVDAASLIDVTYPHNMPVIDHQLISPTVNALGSTNSQGIYVINCGNQDVMIGRSRIVGTLVLINPGAGSCMKDWVSIEPAALGMPSLLIDGNFRIAMNGSGFSETAIGLNLNPAHTPYPYLGGTGNATVADNYSSTLSGLIYATGSITIQGAAQIRGSIVANDSVSITNADVTIAYDDQYLTQPPPGLRDKLMILRTKLGSIQRSVDTAVTP